MKRSRRKTATDVTNGEGVEDRVVIVERNYTELLVIGNYENLPFVRGSTADILSDEIVENVALQLREFRRAGLVRRCEQLRLFRSRRRACEELFIQRLVAGVYVFLYGDQPLESKQGSG